MAGEQLSFNLGPPSPPELVFFALKPDIEAARRMMDVGRWCLRRHGLAARLYGPDRLHLSLAPAMSRRGRRKDDMAAACRAAGRVGAGPFTLTLGRLCSFGGGDRRAAVLRCDGGATALAALRDALRRELAKAGLAQGPAGFQPHVTLFWDSHRIPQFDLEAPVVWTVEEFVLVRSEIGRSRHADLARWPLRDRRA